MKRSPPLHVKRLDELARRYGLPPAAVSGLRGLLELVEKDPHAPTAVREPERGVDRHLADSLIGLEARALREAGVLADLGSGAGFPGLPLALALPHAQVSLVESNRRKCEFLERAVDVSGARNARVVRARAEEWTEGRKRCDAVVARALAPLAVIAEYAAPLLRVGGSAVAWKGRVDQAELQAASNAAKILGLDPPRARRVEPYTGAGERQLVELAKRAVTPERFPRRPGAARKRPLGDSVRAKSAK